MSILRQSARGQLLLAAIAVTFLCGSFFEDTSALHMQLRFDFDAFCKNPDKSKCDDVAAQIAYEDPAGGTVVIDVRLKIRGRWGGKSADCQLPALFVFFDPQDSVGSIFAGQAMLPLTTHCRHLDRRYADYTISEYLAHRIYMRLSPVSVRARLASINYVDTGNNKQRSRYGFFTEHFASVADRNGREFYEPDLLHLDEFDQQGMARHALFQYMIGNLDWSAIKSHNVALFRAPDGSVLPAPFDFDYSGLVSAEYAAPPRHLSVNHVTTRVFRGYCLPDVDWPPIFDEFEAIRDEILLEMQSLPWMSSTELRRVRLWLTRFYDRIESPEGREAIVASCRAVPESLK
ncbi:MAG: hypothetical protein WBN09_05350 [Woeseiaceae bacterium]